MKCNNLHHSPLAAQFVSGFVVVVVDVVVSPCSRGLPWQMPTLFKHHSQAEEVKVAFVGAPLPPSRRVSLAAPAKSV